MRKIVNPSAEGREARLERFLAWTLYAGAALDLFFGLGILIALPRLGELLRIEVPDPPHYVRLFGLLLVFLAGFYALTADDIRSRLPLALWAAAVRLAGAGYFALSVFRYGAPPVLLAFGATDLLLGILHGAPAGVLWRSSRRRLE